MPTKTASRKFTRSNKPAPTRKKPTKVVAPPVKKHEEVKEEAKKLEAAIEEPRVPLEITETEPPVPVPSSVESESSQAIMEPKTSSDSSSKSLFYLVFVFLTTFVIALVGIFTFDWLRKSDYFSGPTPTPAPVVAPQPEPQPTLAPAEWYIEVLNGSGTPGEAKRVADLLKAKGYTVILIGNAETSDYETTEVYIVEKLENQSEEFLNSIRTDLPSAALTGELIDPTSTASARIIVGQE